MSTYTLLFTLHNTDHQIKLPSYVWK